MATETAVHQDFEYFVERFADIQVLRYQVPGFEDLALRRKKFIYFLSQAALSGRDIIWDQNYGRNLMVRRTLEQIQLHFTGDRKTPQFEAFDAYCKRVWFANGIHHHYGNAKFTPDFDFGTLATLMENSPKAVWPSSGNQNHQQFLAVLRETIFDPDFDRKKVNKDPGCDLAQDSAVNFYEGLSENEVLQFYRDKIIPNDPEPPSWGLNSKLIKVDGKPVEKVWRVGGMYTEAIERIVFWLEKAIPLAETPEQRRSLEYLTSFYKTGELKDFDRHCIAWVADTESQVDTINGFIEVYNDPLGFRGTYEAIVSVNDPHATRRIETIARHARWFENAAPIMDEHKKPDVKGITGNVINVVMEAGDCSPSTPIGINLPNPDWIREKHGSKSVNLANIVTALNQAAGRLREEFSYSHEEIERDREHGELSDNLHTDLHEVLGHASGRLNPGVGTPKETLKNYASTLEEARADLVALYFLMDPKLVELGLMPSLDTGKAQYDSYIRNGLLAQLRRISFGDDLEEDHMRNRQLVAAWAFAKGEPGGVIEKLEKGGKTYFTIRDYQRLQTLFGELLREIQRIKSEGDYQAGRDLVETYGVKVDPELHREVLDRFAKLDMAPFYGFVNPELEPVTRDGEIVDVLIRYPESFTRQMLDYAERYSFLPTSQNRQE